MTGKPERYSATQSALLEQLKAPFPNKDVKWRIGQVTKDGKKAMALAYIEAREVYRRLDEVCGVGGWQSKLKDIKDGFICEISIKMPNDEWVTKSDSADFTDIEAIKGGASSAVKRAAAVWGVGRYLYYMPTVWCETKVLYTKKNGDPVYGLKDTPEIPYKFTAEYYETIAANEPWEDVLELEYISKSTEEADTSKTLAEEREELAKKLEAEDNANN